MVDLPYDIWHYITKFMDNRDVKNIHSICRSTLDLALEARYRCVRYDGSTARDLVPLKDPLNARRVRTFTLFPTNLSRCLVAGASKCDQYSLSNVWPGFNDPPQNAEEAPGGTEHIPVDYPSVADTLRTVLGGLTDLETLEVVSKHNAPGFAAFISLKPRFLDLGWPSFYSTLTALSLNVALDALDVVLPPSDVLLPCLSNFTLDLYPHRTRDARTVFKTILVPFISRHAPTLRFLQLSCTTFIDPYGFLADIPFIPSLSSFSVAVPCADPMEMDFSGLEAFLTLHRETLHHFKYGYVQSAHSSSPFHMVLVPPSPEAWYSQGWLKLSFPNLRVLDLSFHYVHNGCHVPPTITYILQYAHTLRELHLWPFVLSFRHLSDLVKGLAEYQVIESLDLVMSNFNADVLELLAAELPQLVSLSIISPSRAFKSSLGPSSQADDVDKIIDGLCALRLPPWALRSLDIHPLVLDACRDHRARHALVHALPQVRLFCGLRKEEYLDSRDGPELPCCS